MKTAKRSTLERYHREAYKIIYKVNKGLPYKPIINDDYTVVWDEEVNCLKMVIEYQDGEKKAQTYVVYVTRELA